MESGDEGGGWERGGGEVRKEEICNVRSESISEQFLYEEG